MLVLTFSIVLGTSTDCAGLMSFLLMLSASITFTVATSSLWPSLENTTPDNTMVMAMETGSLWFFIAKSEDRVFRTGATATSSRSRAMDGSETF